MPQISGTYQGIPLLDCEFEMRTGVDPGRGWCRFLLSSIGKFKSNAKIQQLRAFLNRDGKNFAPVQSTFFPNNEERGGSRATVVLTKSSKPPPGFKNLEGPFGTLIMETGAGDELPATIATIVNVYWTEMILEDISSAQDGEGVVRLELTDERILWGMGGYVMGWRNRTINDLEESVGGKIFQWNPSLQNPTGLVDISEDVVNADEFRPVLDELTLFQRRVPWTVFLLLGDVAQTLPGPPEMQIFAKKISGVTPWNEEYGGGTLSKLAFEDLMNRYRLTLAPNYQGEFIIYDQGQTFVFVRGKELRTTESIPTAFTWELNNVPNVINNTLTPVSYEVIGSRVVEEVACPNWVNVIRDDGSIFQNSNNGLIGRQGKWVPIRDWLEVKGKTVAEARESLMSAYDKSDSSAFIDLFGGDKNDPATKAAATLMKQHFFRSFMVAPGPMRRFLPMLEDRPDGSIPVLNLPNMAIQRPISIFADGWTPSTIRDVGGASLFSNASLERVDPEEIGKIDKEQGVITFKEPRGVVVIQSGFSFVDQTDNLAIVRGIREDWDDNLADEFQKKVQAVLDNLIFFQRKDRKFIDEHFPIRQIAEEFVRARGIEGSVSAEIFLDPKTIAAIKSKAVAIAPETIPNEVSPDAGLEGVNLSEYTIFEPRIFAIWAWERNYGLSSDWYRRRGGFAPELSPMPIELPGLKQYVSLSGATNKKAMDILADITIKQHEEKDKTATEGSVLKFAGFHPVVPSGIVNSVVFKMSVQHPPEAETIVQQQRLEHGIDGRPPAVQSYTAFKKPLGRGFAGAAGLGKTPIMSSGNFTEKRRGRK